MTTATWNNTIIAQSNQTRNVEGNQYFPPSSVNMEFLEKTDHHSFCPWKGEASYYSIIVDGSVNENAAWYYPEVSDAASHIKGYIAFWKGVEVK